MLDHVGIAAVHQTVVDMGLLRTVVVASSGDLNAALADDFVRCGLGVTQALADPATMAGLRVLDPARCNSTTPRDMTTLLARIWRDEAASPTACGDMRRVLRLQVCRHRLASGFPTDDVLVAAKTGTLLNLRNEIGVVELPDGRRYAVAVFTRSNNTTIRNPTAETVIGTTARLAIDQLRAA